MDTKGRTGEEKGHGKTSNTVCQVENSREVSQGGNKSEVRWKRGEVTG